MTNGTRGASSAAVVVVSPVSRPPWRPAPRAGTTIRQALFAGAYDKAIALALEALRRPIRRTSRSVSSSPGPTPIPGGWDEAEALLAELLSPIPGRRGPSRLQGPAPLLAQGPRRGRTDFPAGPRSSSRARPTPWPAWPTWPRGEANTTPSLVYCRRALDLDANHAGALFRIGTVLLWQGDYGRARGYLARAVELEPQNKDFARALAAAVPVFARRTEVWLTGGTSTGATAGPITRTSGMSALFSVLARPGQDRGQGQTGSGEAAAATTDSASRPTPSSGKAPTATST